MFFVILWVFTIGVSVDSGFMAWNWIVPDSFLSGVGFMLLWDILSKTGHLLATFCVFLLSESDQL